jgi:anti-sigma-K factor RskA
MNSSGHAHDIHALSGAYAVDALDAEERVHFEAHLASCESCRAEVAELREASALLPGTAEVDPPAALRDRVLADIAKVRPLPPETPVVHRLPLRRRLTTALVAAAVLAVAGVGTVVWHEATTGTSQGPSVADRVLRASDARRVNVDLPNGASATVIRSISEGRAVLVTRDMPAPPSHRVYELWLQTPAGVMVPAGTMDQAGSRTIVLQGDATTATAAGITVEPEGGSDSPTSDPIALFDFQRAT